MSFVDVEYGGGSDVYSVLSNIKYFKTIGNGSISAPSETFSATIGDIYLIDNFEYQGSDTFAYSGLEILSKLDFHHDASGVTSSPMYIAKVISNTVTIGNSNWGTILVYKVTP